MYMVQMQVYRADCINFIKSVIVGDIQGLHDNHAARTVFTE